MAWMKLAVMVSVMVAIMVAVMGTLAMGWTGALGLEPAKTTTLEALRDQRRILLIFASSAKDPQLKAQEAELRAHAKETQDLDLVAVEAIAGDEAEEGSGDAIRVANPAAVRTRFGVGPDDFAVVLVGKDGGEKLRSEMPISFDRLLATIDAMPMRQNEKKKKQ